VKLRRYAMITTTVGAVLLLLLGAVAAYPGARTRLRVAQQTAIESKRALAFTGRFYIRAKAGGLFPGATRPLQLRFRNPGPFAIKITRVTVDIGRDLRRPGCSPRRYLGPTRLRTPVRVPAKSVHRARTGLKIRMRGSAPDSCQGAVFPLRLKGQAIIP
jgi:hypothetical protein